MLHAVHCINFNFSCHIYVKFDWWLLCYNYSNINTRYKIRLAKSIGNCESRFFAFNEFPTTSMYYFFLVLSAQFAFKMKKEIVLSRTVLIHPGLCQPAAFPI